MPPALLLVVLTASDRAAMSWRESWATERWRRSDVDDAMVTAATERWRAGRASLELCSEQATSLGCRDVSRDEGLPGRDRAMERQSDGHGRRAKRTRLGRRSWTDETELGWRNATNLAIAVRSPPLSGITPLLWKHAPAVRDRLSRLAVERASGRSWAGRRGSRVEMESLAPRPKVEKTRLGRRRLVALRARNESLCRKCLNARDVFVGAVGV
ncbi:hypothetical protein QBC39DRAFT_420411 [Podospora conica]|nr:hypothetical protein QBC39DRAFT_420411 [Schizothecium conicum]